MLVDLADVLRPVELSALSYLRSVQDPRTASFLVVWRTVKGFSTAPSVSLMAGYENLVSTRDKDGRNESGRTKKFNRQSNLLLGAFASLEHEWRPRISIQRKRCSSPSFFSSNLKRTRKLHRAVPRMHAREYRKTSLTPVSIPAERKCPCKRAAERTEASTV